MCKFCLRSSWTIYLTLSWSRNHFIFESLTHSFFCFLWVSYILVPETNLLLLLGTHHCWVMTIPTWEMHFHSRESSAQLYPKHLFLRPLFSFSSNLVFSLSLPLLQSPPEGMPRRCNSSLLQRLWMMEFRGILDWARLTCPASIIQSPGLINNRHYYLKLCDYGH